LDCLSLLYLLLLLYYEEVYALDGLITLNFRFGYQRGLHFYDERCRQFSICDRHEPPSRFCFPLHYGRLSINVLTNDCFSSCLILECPALAVGLQPCYLQSGYHTTGRGIYQFPVIITPSSNNPGCFLTQKRSSLFSTPT